MTGAASALAVVIAGIIHIQSGHSVFYWTARGCIIIDAALICVYRIGMRAAVAWWQRLPRVIEEVQLEVTKP